MLSDRPSAKYQRQKSNSADNMYGLRTHSGNLLPLSRIVLIITAAAAMQDVNDGYT